MKIELKNKTYEVTTKQIDAARERIRDCVEDFRDLNDEEINSLSPREIVIGRNKHFGGWESFLSCSNL